MGGFVGTLCWYPATLLMTIMAVNLELEMGNPRSKEELEENIEDIEWSSGRSSRPSSGSGHMSSTESKLITVVGVGTTTDDLTVAAAGVTLAESAGA